MQVRAGGRRGLTRAVLVLAPLVAVLTGTVVGAAPAAATPWGASGADYTGVLCRLDQTEVPLGAWAVNGGVRAFSTRDISGTGPAQQPAPVNGPGASMTAGQAGMSRDDIGAAAYLIAHHGDGSPAELAEVSADVATLAGSGELQRRCLGQEGTSASRAAARLDEARRYGGPYRVTVTPPARTIPGAQTTVTVDVRSAAGVGTPGLAVAVDVGGAVATASTGGDGTAQVPVTVPRAAETGVTATVTERVGLTYLATDPASLAVADATAARGHATLQAVLHPKPAVTVDGPALLLADGSFRPAAAVTGTYGYPGTGTLTLTGPVQASGGAGCRSLDPERLRGAAVAWQDAYSFTGDARYRATETPQLTPGCYALRATATTRSSPPATAESRLSADDYLTVATLTVSTAAKSPVAGPGDLAAIVTGTDPGRARLTTSVTARGPLPTHDGSCRGVDFDDAPTVGTSAPVTASRVGDALRATATVPSVDELGCYSLTATSEVSLDGATVDAPATPAGPQTTVAVLRPSLTVATAATSGEQGKPMPATVQVAGAHRYPGELAVGLVRGDSVPITGCGDAHYPAPASAGGTSSSAAAAMPTRTRSRTTGDGSYAVRTPVTSANACYAVVAELTLTDNRAVTASSPVSTTTAVFVAGVRPVQAAPAVVRHATGGGFGLRALVIGSTFVLLLLAGSVTVFVRTFRGARTRARWHWRPYTDDDGSLPSLGLS